LVVQRQRHTRRCLDMNALYVLPLSRNVFHDALNAAQDVLNDRRSRHAAVSNLDLPANPPQQHQHEHSLDDTAVTEGTSVHTRMDHIAASCQISQICTSKALRSGINRLSHEP